MEDEKLENGSGRRLSSLPRVCEYKALHGTTEAAFVQWGGGRTDCQRSHAERRTVVKG